MTTHPIDNVLQLPTRAISLALTVTDPDSVTELDKRADGTERDAFALHALRIGVLAMRAASGAIDADAIRREHERMDAQMREMLAERGREMAGAMSETLVEYLDPKSGSFPQRLEELTKQGGEMDRMLARHVGGDDSMLARTIARHVGESSPLFKLLSPQQADGVVASLTKTVEKSLRDQREEILQQFSLDRKDSALARLVGEVLAHNGKLRKELADDLGKVASEFSLDNEHGALSRLVGRVEKAQKTIVEQLSLDKEGSALQRMAEMLKGFAEDNAKFHLEVRTALESMKTRRDVAARAPEHGVDFEEALGDFLATHAEEHGHLHESVGATPSRSGRKVGDHVITLGPDAAAAGVRIVCEAKGNKSYTDKDALDELAVARRNREAQIGVFVFERASVAEGTKPLRRIGHDVLVVWDAADAATDLYLDAALSVAVALAVVDRRDDVTAKASFREIDSAIHEIAALANVMEDIARAARAVQKKGENILGSAEGAREMLLRQLAALRRHLAALRGSPRG